MPYMLNITIPCNVGDITQKKIDALKRVLSDKYNNGIMLQNQIVMTDKSRTINIMPNQIVYSGPNNDCNEIARDINLVFDTLLLNNDLQIVVVDIQGIKSFTGNFMDYTKEKYTKNIDDAIGVGIRNFFIIDSQLCEFKVEPLLSDYNKIFMQGIYNYKNVKTEDIERLIKKSLDDYIPKVEGIE